MSNNIKTNQKQVDLQYYIKLWEKLNDAALNSDNRNMGTLNLSSLVAGAALILASTLENVNILNYSVFLVPAIILISFFYNAFNNKITAILKGYLSGLEEIINTELDKNLFQWNSRYIQIYRIPYFLANDTAGIMFFIMAIALVSFSFIKIFQFQSKTDVNKTLYLIFFIAYLILFVVFSIIFAIDTFSNGKTTKISHDYFVANYKSKELITTDKSNARLLKEIYKQYKKSK